MADEQLKIDVVLRNFASKELKKVDSDIARFGRAALAPFRAVTGAVFSLKGALAGLGVALTAKGLFDLVKGTADQADRIRDLSIELGASTEALSELEHVAKQSGASLDSLATGFRFLQKAVGEFRLEGSGPLAELLDRLSPAFREMVDAGAPVEDLFQQFSREIRNLGEAERVFVTSKLFGRGGAGLLPTLSENLDEARLKAKAFGATIGREAADAADAFNDALGELGLAATGIKREVVDTILPDFTKGIQGITSTLLENKPAILRFMADVIEGTGTFGSTLLMTFRDLEQRFGSLLDLFTRGKILALEVEGAVKDIASKIGPDPFGELKRQTEEADKEARRLINALNKAADDRSKLLADTAGVVGSTAKGAADQLRRLADESQRFREDMEFVGPRLEDIFDEFGPTLEQARGTFDEAGEGLDRMDRGLTQVTASLEEQSSAWQREREAIFGVRAALSDLGAEYQKWGDAAYQATIRVADALGSNTTDALLEVIEGTKSAKEVFRDFGKAVLKDIARIIIQLLIMKAIEAGAGLGSVIGNNIRVNAAVSGAAKGGVVGGHLEPVRGHMADGGIVRQRGLFELREGGRNEAVVPLPDNRRIPVELRGGGGQTITQTINVYYQSTALTTAEERRFIQQNMKQIAAGIAREIKESAAFRENVRAA
jgi:ABC-type transporter Mla subunit MlaD